MLIKAGELQRNIGGRAFIVLLVALVTLMPTYSAFAEIHATPVVEPTPTPIQTGEKDEAANRDGATEEMTPNLGAPKAQNESPVNVASEDFTPPGTGRFTECTQDGRLLDAGDLLSITCHYRVSNLAALAPYTRVTRPNMLNGLKSSIRIYRTGDNPSNGAFLDFDDAGPSVDFRLATLIVAGGVDLTLVIQIKAPDAIQEGVMASHGFSVCATLLLTGCSELGSVTANSEFVTHLRGGNDTAPHYRFVCGEPSISSASVGQQSEIACQIVALSELGNRSIKVEGISLSPSSIDGWQLGLDDPEQGRILSAGGAYGFRILLSPVACTSDAILTVASILIPLNRYGERAGSEVFPAIEQSVDFEQTSEIATAGVEENSSSLNVTSTYSHTEEVTKSAVLTIEVNSVGCSPLRVSVSMLPFTWDTELTGQPPPVGEVVPRLSRTAHAETQPELPEGLEAKPSPIDSPFTGSPTLVLTTSTQDGTKKTSSHIFDLEYTIPAGTPVGIYTSTITVTISDAP